MTSGGESRDVTSRKCFTNKSPSRVVVVTRDTSHYSRDFCCSALSRSCFCSQTQQEATIPTKKKKKREEESSRWKHPPPYTHTHHYHHPPTPKSRLIGGPSPRPRAAPDPPVSELDVAKPWGWGAGGAPCPRREAAESLPAADSTRR